jgi:DNA polymerase-2
MIKESSGFVLDIYEDQKGRGNIVWIIDDSGERIKLFHLLPVTIYANGENSLKRAAWKYLRDKYKDKIILEKVEKIHPFSGDKVSLLAIYSRSTQMAKQIGKDLEKHFPQIDLFDISVEIAQRYAALFNIFPLAYIKYVYDDETNYIEDLWAKEERWGDQKSIPLRVLELNSEFNPLFHKGTLPLEIHSPSFNKVINFNDSMNFELLLSIIKRVDPDVIISDFGDSYFLEEILKRTKNYCVPIPLSRDEDYPPLIKEPMVVSTYGRIVRRHQQIILYGRIHIDRKNMHSYDEGGLDLIQEISRVSGLSLQTVPRSTPGKAVASLEIIEALKSNTVLPHKTQKNEKFRSGLEFIDGDRGGLIFLPPQGVHENVLCIDFDSMFPSIMVKKNLSPETIDQKNAAMGVLPRALQPLVERRLWYKRTLQNLSKFDSRFRIYKNRSDGLKWLLVVSFGYSGFRAAPLSSPTIFENVNKNGREAMIKAKEIAEVEQYEVLHAYIDGLFLKSHSQRSQAEIQYLLDEITRRTDLPISIEGIFNWVVFLGSKGNSLFSVPNSYFGAFQNGTIKVRGIECRRSDQPKLIKESQTKMIEILAKGQSMEEVRKYIPEVFEYIMTIAKRIIYNDIPHNELTVSMKLSKDLNDYKVKSHAALAATQLHQKGYVVGAGSHIKFLYVRGAPRVLAWDLSHQNKYYLDKQHYLYLLEKASKTILSPFGVTDDLIHNLTRLDPAKQLRFLLH